MAKKNIYFKGLTELRGVAAIMVIIHHIELYKHRQLERSLYNGLFSDIIGDLGKNGVYIFFVLSGFLITYLLLQEVKISKTIAIKNFYLRRILRIWPLYFIILIISFFIVPFTLNTGFFAHETYYQSQISKLQYGANLVLFMLFLSNVALKVYPPVVGAAQSWSVSVEEQFYLLWPLLLKGFTDKLGWVLLVIALGKPMLIFSLSHGLRIVGLDFKYFDIVLSIVNEMKFEFMALGGILALCFMKIPEVFDKFLKGKFPLFAMLLLVCAGLFFSFHSYIMALIYTGMIGTIVANGIESKIFKGIGEVSYGIYMYHPLIMYCVFALAHFYFPDLANNFIYYNLFVYGGVTLSTYLISYLSYHYVESFFLRLKNKYSIITSNLQFPKAINRE